MRQSDHGASPPFARARFCSERLDFLMANKWFHLRPELVHDLLQVLNGGQLLPHGRRKLSGHVICGDANRLIDGLQSEFHDRTAPALAEENSDAWSFDRGSHGAVHRRKVKAQFAGMFGLEGTHL
jgi:hypothetical protein